MSQDQIYTVAAICMVLITACVIYVSYYAIQALKKANNAMRVIENTASDMDIVRNGIKNAMLRVINRFVQSQGGDNFESK